MEEPARVLIVEARFYDDLADELAAGAIEALQEAGVEIERLPVPGVLEVPAAISLAEGSAEYDAYVALGVVIRGETSHYDIVAIESARALQTLAIEFDCCIGNGILTVENGDQAWARARRSEKNKGRDAAIAALRMLEIKNRFSPNLEDVLSESKLTITSERD